MRVIETIGGFKEAVSESARPIGLVPTMGALHAGHMALVQQARADNVTVAVSIFVNPVQFGPQEDYKIYPRPVDADLSKLEEAKIDLVLMPSKMEMYPNGFGTYVDVGLIGQRLEGKSRPSHFRGVATVVCKLLSITRPDRAYFGQKDGQQALIIKKLNSDLNLGAEIVVVPTVREVDGLALSSRNIYLSVDERRASTILRRALLAAQNLGTSDAREMRRVILETIDREPLAQVDYVSVADSTMLEELDRVNVPAIVSLAVWIGSVRLIDNILIGPSE